MFAMLFVLLVSLGNFALGFALASHFGHGPSWGEFPSPNTIRTRLRRLLGMGKS
jgi:hypothetical protein